MSIEKSLGSKSPSNRQDRIKRNVNRTVAGVFLLPLLMAFIGIYSGFIQNKDEEFCKFVEEGKSHHIMFDGMPCVLQFDPISPILLTSYLMWSPLLLPAVLAWLYYRWWAK